jgi:hypothetical protein
MSRINLNLVAPFGLHLVQRDFGIFKHYRVLHISEANGNARRVTHGVCASTYDVGGKRASGRAENKLEGIFRIYFEPGKLSGGVCVRRRYRSETLTVSVNVKGAQVGCSEFN